MTEKVSRDSINEMIQEVQLKYSNEKYPVDVHVFLGDSYESIDKIDFSTINNFFRGLPLIVDDLFMAMQAINISLVDHHITQLELELLSRLNDEERTPVDLALLVSGLSQMWIFSVYELIRTWKQRLAEMINYKKNNKIDDYIESFNSTERELDVSMISRIRQAEKCKGDSEFIDKYDKINKEIDDLYFLVSAFRMNMAKHETINRSKFIPPNIGYGRINQWCGSIDYQISLKEKIVTRINRRDIADLLRKSKR